jgi:hypothetical protein
LADVAAARVHGGGVNGGAPCGVLSQRNRPWTLRLIEEMNPRWDDLFDAIIGSEIRA